MTANPQMTAQRRTTLLDRTLWKVIRVGHLQYQVQDEKSGLTLNLKVVFTPETNPSRRNPLGLDRRD